MDNLLGNPIFVDITIQEVRLVPRTLIVVSPDVGSVARARAFAQKLPLPLAIVDKRRQKANSCEVMNVIGDVEGKHVILLTTWWTPAAPCATPPRPWWRSAAP